MKFAEKVISETEKISNKYILMGHHSAIKFKLVIWDAEDDIPKQIVIDRLDGDTVKLSMTGWTDVQRNCHRQNFEIY